MRKVWIMMALMVVGCASKQDRSEKSAIEKPVYIDNPVSSMVFQHPILADASPGFYSREGLAPGAFVAYEQPEATIYEIRTDDRLENTEDGWMYRRAFSQRFGVSYR